MALREGFLSDFLYLGGITAFDFTLLGLGIWCLLFVDVQYSTSLEREYMRVNVCTDTDLPSLYCTDFKPSMSPYLTKCECEFGIVVDQDMKGAVTLYYELDEFDQTNSSYASSKDDEQLLGTPGQRPADSCGNYSYINTTPIFPCGEIADSIFNDTFTLMKNDDNIPVEYSNLLNGDTFKYRNPPPEVVKNFSSPRNWGRLQNGDRPWEAGTELKGVENPAFRAWMDTSLKRKPVWRVQRTGPYADGLPAGNYTLTIMMHYGVDRYAGPRTIILEGVYTEATWRSLGWGITLIVAGIILLLFLACYIYIAESIRGVNSR